MRAVIYGKTQSGKTYFAHYVASQYIKQDKRDRVVVTDSDRGQFDENLDDLGFEYMEITGEHGSINFYNALQKYPKLFLHFHSITGKEMGKKFNKLAKDIKDLGNTLLIIDEAYQVFHLNASLKHLEELVRSGAKAGLDWILISQQPVDLAMPGRSQSSSAFTFQLTTPRHIKKLTDIMPEVEADQIKGLEKREFILYDENSEREVGKGSTEGLKISLN